MTNTTNLAEWVRDHAITADTLDPHAPLDDLEPLRDVIGDARVVAIKDWIANERQRRIDQQYSGSGQVEKANDLNVARRQKGRSLQWSLETSDALAALRTLLLNGGTSRYWQQRQILPLAAT